MRRLFISIVLVACSHAGSNNSGDDDQPKPDAPPVVHPDAQRTPDGPSIDATTYAHLCDAPIPPGSPMPAVPNPPVAGCPTLVSGSNLITTSGKSRNFLLVIPANLQPEEHLPVLFMWHWLGGSAQDFLERGDVQTAADQQRFIAVLPNAEGAPVLGTQLDTKWPFDITQLPSRMDEEFTFFDDMLACVEQQLHVNASCVSSVGVSAGALFTDQLVQARSTMFANFLSLSGGVNDTIIKPWNGAAHPLPGIVLWGGDGPPNMDGNKDILGCLGIGMDFSVASRDLEAGMGPEDMFMIECRHNCGHVEPPLDAPPGESKYAALWDFAMNHPYWLAPGQSPYLQTGLPSTMPAWCAIGAGNSVPRSGGGCPPAENPCAF